ncbi:MAG: NYN domain-containing protein [Bacteroides sp.]
MFGFGRPSKPRASVFVDYEHWYYGYHNNFHMKPNFEEWLQELENEFEIAELFVFGDFSEKLIGNELPLLQRMTKDVVHTASDKQGVDKDFTDVIILDAIYRSAARKKGSDVYVLFTGDAHFTKVVEYLKELGKKVIIYGVKFGFSNALKSAATSYVEMPRQVQVKNHYNDLILASLDKLRSKPGKTPSYWKTVTSVAQYNRVPEDRVKKALDGLINQKYINKTMRFDARGDKIFLLYVDWNKLKEDGLWQ